MTEAAWSRRFSSGGSRSMRAARIACAVAGICNASGVRTQPIGAPLPDQHPGLHEGLDALLQEEGVPLGPLDQHPLERRQARVLTQERGEQGFGALGRQRVDPELEVVGLAAPGVLVLGPVVDEEQEAGRRQALDQAVEQRLGLGVDPVEILEDHQERLDLALSQEQPLDRLQGALPALRRVERVPRGILDGDVEQRQERRQERLQRAVQRQELAGHALADRPRVVALLDPAVRLQRGR